MGYCEICGKPISEHFTICKKCGKVKGAYGRKAVAIMNQLEKEGKICQCKENDSEIAESG